MSVESPTAFQEGVQAAAKESPIEDCPYHAGTISHLMWVMGWREAVWSDHYLEPKALLWC
ncbi:ribosome modulation factor [Methylobacterium soli]